MFVDFDLTYPINSVRAYLLDTNVQLGASYKVSKQSTSLYEAGIHAAAQYVHARDDEIGTPPSAPPLT